MSVDIEIKQAGLFKKNLDLNFLKGICENYGFSYGVPNHAVALDDYQGGKDITGVVFTVYNRKKIGRGFNFWIDNKKSDCCLRLNNPCTDNDINDFYDFLQTTCERLKAKSFLQDGEIKPVEEIIEIRKNITQWNRQVLRDQIAADYREWCIFGAVYPIYLEDSFREQIPYLSDRDAMASYTKYLHDKQIKDYYYAKAIMYSDNEGNLFGRYAITEGVRSIFPLGPYITIGTHLDMNTEVRGWSVSLGIFENGEYNAAGVISFYNFVNILSLKENANMFDVKHVIIELNKKDINMLVEKSARIE